MTTPKRKKAKVNDAQIVVMNSVGISLSTIAYNLGCHPSTVTNRLKALNIDPVDTRQTFMEDVFMSLSPVTQEWMANEIASQGIHLKDFLKNTIEESQANFKGKIDETTSE